MGWFKNEWGKGGKSFPEHIENSIDRWFSGESNDDVEAKEYNNIQQTTENVSLGTRDGKYGFELYFRKSNNLFYTFDVNFIEFKKKDSEEIKHQYSANSISTLIIKAFYGNTLEIDPGYSSENPFNRVIDEDAKYNGKAVTVYDAIKAVTDARSNANRLSIVVIGNYANIKFDKGEPVYQTEQNKKNNIPLNISEHNFMQQRAIVFTSAFLSGISSPITSIAADDPSNTYKENLVVQDPNPLVASQNIEGISVLFFPTKKSVSKF